MTEKKIIRKQTGVRIEEDLLKRLKYLSVDTGRSVSSLMSEAVKDFLDKHSKKKK